jgi:hypothetical protein
VIVSSALFVSPVQARCRGPNRHVLVSSFEVLRYSCLIANRGCLTFQSKSDGIALPTLNPMKNQVSKSGLQHMMSERARRSCIQHDTCISISALPTYPSPYHRLSSLDSHTANPIIKHFSTITHAQHERNGHVCHTRARRSRLRYRPHGRLPAQQASKRRIGRDGGNSI